MFMASSSTTARNPQQKYQVFLSFRGEDTRHNFTSHLHKALCEKGVATFIDNELERGEEISPSLLSAIQGSMMSVIVFSKTYPSSRWCLQELVEIIKCKNLHGQIVIPVFYHVDPSHIRRQNGTFENLLAELEKRFDREVVERWSRALAEAGNLSGWTLDAKTSEAQIVKEIVKDVLKRLRTAIPLSNYKELVGIEPRIEDIESLLKWIMMHDLLEEMGREIVMGEKDLDKRSRLWHYKDIKYVLTKNKGSYKTRGIWLDKFKTKDILHLNPLSFSKMDNLMFLKVYTAFNSQVDGFSAIESDFTELRYLYWPGYPCKSLPLNFRPENLVSLEMPNSNLEQLWTGLQNLGRLKYVDLENSSRLLKIPDLSQAPNLETLNLNECTSLIEITLPSTQELKLVNLNLRNCKSLNNLPPGIQSKSLVLSGCTNLTAAPKISSDMVCLCLDGTGIGEFTTSNEYPSGITRLNLASCSRLEKLPFGMYKWESLQRLTLSYCSNLKTIPKMPPKLGTLFLDGTAVEELTSSIDHLSNLEWLSLGKCSRLKCLPSDISNLKSLRYLRLSGCSNLKMLPKFQDCRIRELYLNGTAIEQLPSSFVENLSCLETLDVKCCASLESLPGEIFRLKCLKTLYLSGCSRLERLPDDLGNLEALGKLDTGGIALREVPTSFARFEMLEYLNFNGCKNTELVGSSLPTLSGFYSLIRLDLADCCITELPNGLGNLYSLGYLNMSKNNFGSIPTSIINLSQLKLLLINRCNRLQSLPTLPYGLHELQAMCCTSLQASSDLRTRNVYFVNCLNLDLNSAIYTSFVDNVQSFMCFPGREIPEWFDRQGSGCSIELPRGSFNNNYCVGFAFCVILSFKHFYNEEGSGLALGFRLDVKNEDGDYEEFYRDSQIILRGQDAICIESDHVLMGYRYLYNNEGCQLSKSSEAVLNFNVFNWVGDEVEPVEGCQVKKAGVHLFFTHIQASSLGLRNNGGETFEVQRVHIERFTGRRNYRVSQSPRSYSSRTTLD